MRNRGRDLCRQASSKAAGRAPLNCVYFEAAGWTAQHPPQSILRRGWAGQSACAAYRPLTGFQRVLLFWLQSAGSANTATQRYYFPSTTALCARCANFVGKMCSCSGGCLAAHGGLYNACLYVLVAWHRMVFLQHRTLVITHYQQSLQFHVTKQGSACQPCNCKLETIS